MKVPDTVTTRAPGSDLDLTGLGVGGQILSLGVTAEDLTLSPRHVSAAKPVLGLQLSEVIDLEPRFVPALP